MGIVSSVIAAAAAAAVFCGAGNLYAQNQPPAPGVGVRVFKMNREGEGISDADMKTLDGLMHEALAPMEKYHFSYADEAADDPSIPPGAEAAAGEPYALTALVVDVPASKETHIQLWIYDVGAEKLCYTDEMVYEQGNFDEVKSYLSPLVEYGLSFIPEPVKPDEPVEAAEGAEGAEPAEPDEPVEAAEPEFLLGEEEGGGRRLPFPVLVSFQYKPTMAIFGYFQRYHPDPPVVFPVGAVLNAACLPWEFNWGRWASA